MDDVHATHGTAGIVKNPFLLNADVLGRLGAGAQLVDNVAYNGARVVAVLGDGLGGQLVQVLVVKDVEGFEALLGKVNERRDDGQEDSHEAEEPADWGRHGCWWVLSDTKKESIEERMKEWMRAGHAMKLM